MKQPEKVLEPQPMRIIWYWWLGAGLLGGSIWGAGIAWWLA